LGVTGPQGASCSRAATRGLDTSALRCDKRKARDQHEQKRGQIGSLPVVRNTHNGEAGFSDPCVRKDDGTWNNVSARLPRVCRERDDVRAVEEPRVENFRRAKIPHVKLAILEDYFNNEAAMVSCHTLGASTLRHE
jgi:hypothetical protein